MLLDCTELDSNQRTLDSDPTGAATKLLKRHFQIVFFIFFPPPPSQTVVRSWCFVLFCVVLSSSVLSQLAAVVLRSSTFLKTHSRLSA